LSMIVADPCCSHMTIPMKWPGLWQVAPKKRYLQ
jgi:hypothetical protein